MEWNYDLALQLIDEYRRHPLLWNSKDSYYYNKSKKREAWEEIAKNVKVHVVEVKQKMNSLLGSFRRERSRGRKRIGTKKGTKDIYVSKWFAFSRMSFLLDRNVSRDPDDNLVANDVQIEEPDIEREIFGDISPTPEDVNVLEENPFSSLNPPSPKRAKKRIHSVEEYSKTNEDFNVVRNNTASASVSEDSCCLFGNYIGAKLREYNKTTRAMVQHQINNVIYKADMGKYDNPIYIRESGNVKQELSSPFLLNSPGSSALNSPGHPFHESPSPVSKISPVGFL